MHPAPCRCSQATRCDPGQKVTFLEPAKFDSLHDMPAPATSLSVGAASLLAFSPARLADCGRGTSRPCTPYRRELADSTIAGPTSTARFLASPALRAGWSVGCCANLTMAPLAPRAESFGLVWIRGFSPSGLGSRDSKCSGRTLVKTQGFFNSLSRLYGLEFKMQRSHPRKDSGGRRGRTASGRRGGQAIFSLAGAGLKDV